MKKLPTKYKEWIPRVSDIVSFIYPFDGEWEQRYLDWLSKNWIKQSDYMLEATTVGTFVHKQMENYILGHEQDVDDELYSLHRKEIEFWLEFLRIKKEQWAELFAELYIRDKYNRFQWTIDLVIADRKNKKVWLVDFKTYWIAKKRWGLPNTYRKPYDKLKKVSLQLSLYAEYFRQKGYNIEELAVLILRDDMAKEEIVKELTSEEINEVISKFLTVDTKLPAELTLKINNMIIELQTTIPDEAYSKASITLEENDYEWKAIEERIEEAVRLQKLLIATYKKQAS